MAYCIRAPGYVVPSSTMTDNGGPSSTSKGPPAPTHRGQPGDCNKWHVVVEGDSCGSVAEKHGIRKPQFFEWNPAVSKDCVNNFWLGQAYCVGVGGKNALQPPATTTEASDKPSPTQEGNAVPECAKFAQAHPDDNCGVFADRNNVSLEQLYTWNKALGKDGGGCADRFWANYWYCVAVRNTRARPIIFKL